MARATMADLIGEVRRIAGAGTAEYTAADQTWWSDDQIQALLDQHRRDIVREPLGMEQTYAGGGSITWTVYRSRHRHIEAGTAAIIEDGLGDNRGTADYTLDGRRGVVTFAADQGGTALYLTGAAYDLHGAAAELLEAWSAALSLDFGFSTDNQRFDRQQKAQALAQRAGEQRRRSWARVLRFD